MTQAHLTPRQQRCVQGYAVDLNATQAAIRAGYSPKTAIQKALQTDEARIQTLTARVFGILALRSGWTLS